MINLLTDIEQLRVEPDQLARIVIDERSGIIIMGKDIRISTVAVAQGNLTVTINEAAAGQPAQSIRPRPDRGDARRPTSRSTPRAATSSRSSTRA